MRALLFLLALLPTAAIAAKSEDAKSWKSYHNETLGIKFRHPAGWTISPCDGNSFDPAGCALKIEAKKSAVWITLLPGDLNAAIKTGSVFQKHGKNWITAKEGASKAISIKNNGWNGLYATYICTIQDMAMEAKDAGECFTAALSTGKKAALIDSDGTSPELNKSLKEVVQTMVLVKEKKKASKQVRVRTGAK